MTGRRSGQSDRGLSSTTGLILFIAIGALLTASGTYLMLELGNEDIGTTTTTVFEAEQDGETVTLKHSGGDSVPGENLRVVGGTVTEMPEEVRPGKNIELIPTETEIELHYEDGRVSQELLTTEVDLTRLVVTVEDEQGNALDERPVGVYALSTTPTVSSQDDIRSAIQRLGDIPTPSFVGATDESGQFATTTTTRDELEIGGRYVVVTATTGPTSERSYAVGSLTLDSQENTVRLTLTN